MRERSARGSQSAHAQQPSRGDPSGSPHGAVRTLPLLRLIVAVGPERPRNMDLAVRTFRVKTIVPSDGDYPRIWVQSHG